MTTALDHEDERCPICPMSWNALREMLADVPGEDNWEYAQKIIGNCKSCREQMLKEGRI